LAGGEDNVRLAIEDKYAEKPNSEQNNANCQKTGKADINAQIYESTSNLVPPLHDRDDNRAENHDHNYDYRPQTAHRHIGNYNHQQQDDRKNGAHPRIMGNSRL